MEPEISLRHSQVPANCPYPEPARSSPLPISLLEDPVYYYPPIKTLYTTVLSLYVSLALPIYFLHLTTDNNCRYNKYCLIFNLATRAEVRRPSSFL